MSIVIETERIILRHFTTQDTDKLAEIYSDPVTMRFLRTRTYQETIQNLDWIFKCYEKYGFGLWAAIAKENNTLIGRCGLIAQNVDETRETEIAYMFSRHYWGKGLGTEAACGVRDYGFNELGYNRLISLIDPDNLASQKVALKTGLTYEKDTFIDGKKVRIYAITSY